MSATWIEPKDEADPFCTCPSCRQLGTHGIAWTVHRTRTVPSLDGDLIDVSMFGDPPDGTKQTVRTCRFCGHVWRRSYGEVAE